MRKNAHLGWLSAGLILFSASQLPAANLNAGDRHFLIMAAEANMKEAHLGQAAQNQSTDTGVKDLGNTLAQDHTKAYEQLSMLAAKMGEEIPKGINVAKDASLNGILKLKGNQFDRHFLQHEIQDHKKTIAAFRHEAERGQDADLKAYASQMIPSLEKHLNMAQDLAKSTKSGS